jgi:hypothetical protein
MEFTPELEKFGALESQEAEEVVTPKSQALVVLESPEPE